MFVQILCVKVKVRGVEQVHAGFWLLGVGHNDQAGVGGGRSQEVYLVSNSV